MTNAKRCWDMVSGMNERRLGQHYLRQWRKHRGLSLRKLAARMEREPGIELTSHANIQRIELFEQPYTQEILEAAASALNCSVADLLTVDPKKDAQVIDMVRLLKSADPIARAGVIAMLEKMQTGTK